MARYVVGWSILTLLALVTIGTAAADIPNPGRRRTPRPEETPRPVPQQVTAPVQVEYADLSKAGDNIAAKIRIPARLLDGRLRSESAPAPTSEAKQSSVRWWSTIIAGIALSAGAVGLLAVARGKRGAQATAMIALACGAMMGGYAFADLRPPKEEKLPNVIIDFFEGGGPVIVTLPK